MYVGRRCVEYTYLKLYQHTFANWYTDIVQRYLINFHKKKEETLLSGWTMQNPGT